MLCKKPYRQGVAEYGCGQCMPCRINRRELWTSRLLLESQTSAWSWFVTLTYAELPKPFRLKGVEYPEGSVSPRALQLFLKRLRRNSATRLRFYAVGEYGGLFGRAHYHLALFGLPDPCHVSPRDVEVLRLPPCSCAICKAWSEDGVSLGGVDVREIAEETAYYIVKYHTESKKRGQPRADGRHPAFQRMSLKPGIGAVASEVIAEALTSDAGARKLLREGDVPAVVRWQKRMRPLGRYLRRKIRQELGMDAGMPEPAQAVMSMRRQAELLLPGAREKRERKREASAARAEVLNQIQNSKGKGI